MAQKLSFACVEMYDGLREGWHTSCYRNSSQEHIAVLLPCFLFCFCAVLFVWLFFCVFCFLWFLFRLLFCWFVLALGNWIALWTTEEARTCEALFQLTFRPQKWKLKAHMWYQLSPFPSSNVAICAAAPPRQHSPILRYSGYSATPCCVFIQLPNVIDTISKRWRSKKAFNTLPSHIFS